MLKIPLDRSQSLTIWARDINLDDFAFDAEGNLYGATHVENSVVRITPRGQVTVVAETVGSTAVAFGTGANADAVFVTTNGGLSNPPKGGPQPARVVRIEVGKSGAPVP